jgi:hypothetical protein
MVELEILVLEIEVLGCLMLMRWLQPACCCWLKKRSGQQPVVAQPPMAAMQLMTSRPLLPVQSQHS